MAQEGIFPGNRNIIVNQETKAGVLPVSIEFTSVGEIDRVMMTQKKPVLKDIYLDISEVASSLNISLEELDESFPKQAVSTGLFTLPIHIKSLTHMATQSIPTVSYLFNACAIKTLVPTPSTCRAKALLFPISIKPA
jgi:predicted PhzF superfamily epimerase YddE/YHI9